MAGAVAGGSSATHNSQLRLRLQVASFSALQAVVHAVGTEADIVRALAYAAVFVALTAVFFQVANHAAISFRHGANVPRNAAAEKGAAHIRLPKTGGTSV